MVLFLGPKNSCDLWFGCHAKTSVKPDPDQPGTDWKIQTTNLPGANTHDPPQQIHKSTPLSSLRPPCGCRCSAWVSAPLCVGCWRGNPLAETRFARVLLCRLSQSLASSTSPSRCAFFCVLIFFTVCRCLSRTQSPAPPCQSKNRRCSGRINLAPHLYYRLSQSLASWGPP